MSKIFFLFGLHNHQPVGNFEHVFSHAYDNCYAPLLDALRKFPAVRLSMHHSGPLLEWLEKEKPEYIEALRDMVKKNQVEILSGGFYEPILSSLPKRDAVGQIKMMNEWIEKNLHTRPRGAWLAERIWDPALPDILADADMEYTLLDDTHFYYAGLNEKEMHGYWVTERHGKAIAVFPVDKNLRYSIPFKLPEETLEYWRSLAEKLGTTGVTYGDDGEKFGVWPDTHKWVFGEKWLERFLAMITKNPDVVETITYSEYIDRFPPSGRIYLPMASYEEMMQWALSPKDSSSYAVIMKKLEAENHGGDFRKFLRGGIWDNFLVKYEESNNLHKKMLYVSNRAQNALAKTKSEKNIAQLKRELYKGQCNCPYWHGLFGGLYLGNLRHAVYSHLINSGKIADRLLHKGGKWVEVNVIDFFKNFGRDAVIETSDLFVLINPSNGGNLAELDYKPASFNISNVMTRRPEEYHNKIVEAASRQEDNGKPLSIHDRVVLKEDALEQKLVFDKYTRRSFIDHLLETRPDVDQFQKGDFQDNGGFTEGRYEMLSAVKKGSVASIALCRKSDFIYGEKRIPIEIRKSFFINGGKPEVSCEYKIKNLSDETSVRFVFGVEWNFTLLADDAPDRYITIRRKKQKMNSKGVTENLKKWSLTDEFFRFSMGITSSRPVELLRFPVETVSQSEDGFGSDYQGTAFIALSDVAIKPGGIYSQKFKIDCTMLR